MTDDERDAYAEYLALFPEHDTLYVDQILALSKPYFGFQISRDEAEEVWDAIYGYGE